MINILLLLIFKTLCNKIADKIAAVNPNRYSAINVNPCKLKIPNTCLSGITNAIKIAYTGKRAEQVVNGTTKMVINRSFQQLIFRDAIIAGIAQAVPEINGITLFPLIPNFRIILSIKNTTLLMYPVSSKTAMNKNKMAI